jgi:integrase/recombinase XerD
MRKLRELAGYGELGVRAAEFLEMRQAKHFSPRTVEWNESNLRAFFNWCEERSLRNPTEITRPILERYQRWLFYYRTKAGKPLSVASQHKRLAAVVAFFKWMARSNLILFNPASEIDLPRLDRRLPRDVLTVSEVEQVLNLPDVSKPSGIRDRAILETLYSTGIRRSELVKLGIYDVSPEAGTLMVRLGKGRRDRVVPIGERALGWIEKYLVDVRPHDVVEPDEGVLFLSYMGTGFLPHSLSDLVRGYIEAARIGKAGSCHLFRHTMATLMLESGADIRFIQAMLGHASLETTSIYTLVSIKKLKEVHELTHPGARLGRSGQGSGASDQSKTAAAELLATLDAEAEEETTPVPGGEGV